MTILKLVFAVILGFVVGSGVNMGLIQLGMLLIPAPGVDFSTAETMKATAHLLRPVNYVFPFLAHALGTLAGAFVATWIAPAGKPIAAWIVGVFFLAGGIAASVMIPGSKIFIALDLALAYLPMTWLAIRLGDKLRS